MRLKTSDGFDINTVVTEIEASPRAVILAHGLSVHSDDEPVLVKAEEFLNSAGFTTVRFDFRCHGKSSGLPEKDFSITGEIIDLETVMDHVLKEPVKWLGIAGASFGAGTAAIEAGRASKRIQALALVNPVLDYQQTFLNPTTEWARKHFADAEERIERDGYAAIGSRQFKAGKPLFDDMKEYVPFAELEKYQAPLLIVQGDEDNTISHRDVYNMFVNLSNSNKELEIVHGAAHGFREDPYMTQAAELVADFFVENV